MFVYNQLFLFFYGLNWRWGKKHDYASWNSPKDDYEETTRALKHIADQTNTKAGEGFIKWLIDRALALFQILEKKEKND